MKGNSPQQTSKHRFLAPSDLRLVQNMADRAASVWLRNDLKKFDRARVQVEHRIENLYTGYADLILYGPNRAMIVDWKTTTGLTKLEEHQRHWQRSWQGLLYSWAFSIPDVSYRIIDIAGNYREVKIRFKEEDWMHAMNHVLACKSMVDALKPLPVWPTIRQDHTCRDCEFAAPCYAFKGPYSVPEDPPKPTHLSYSSMRRLLDCPEKFRRHLFVEEQQDRKTWAQEIGLAFEEAISKIYLERFGIENGSQCEDPQSDG